MSICSWQIQFVSQIWPFALTGVICSVNASSSFVAVERHLLKMLECILINIQVSIRLLFTCVRIKHLLHKILYLFFFTVYFFNFILPRENFLFLSISILVLFSVECSFTDLIMHPNTRGSGAKRQEPNKPALSGGLLRWDRGDYAHK